MQSLIETGFSISDAIGETGVMAGDQVGNEHSNEWYAFCTVLSSGSGVIDATLRFARMRIRAGGSQ